MADPPEPDERDLPEKPPIADMPPLEGDPPPADEGLGETTFMRPQDAEEDPTVDNQENDAGS